MLVGNIPPELNLHVIFSSVSQKLLTHRLGVVLFKQFSSGADAANQQELNPGPS